MSDAIPNAPAPQDPIVTGTPAEAAQAILEPAAPAVGRDPVTGQFVARAAEVPAADTPTPEPVSEPAAEPSASAEPESPAVHDVPGIGPVPVSRLADVFAKVAGGEWDLAERREAFAREQAAMSQKVAEASAAMERAGAMLAMAAQDPEGFIRLAQSPAVQAQMGQPIAPQVQQPAYLTEEQAKQLFTSQLDGLRAQFETQNMHSNIGKLVIETVPDGHLGALTEKVRSAVTQDIGAMIHRGEIKPSTQRETVKGIIARLVDTWRKPFDQERQRVDAAKQARAQAAAAIPPSPSLAVTPAPTAPKDSRPYRDIPAKEFAEKFILPLAAAREPEV